MKNTTHNSKSSHGNNTVARVRRTAICAVTAMAIAVPGFASASVISQVSSKVNSVYGQVRLLREQTNQLMAGMYKTKNSLRDGTIDALVNSVQPIVQLVRDRQQEFQAFDAEGFRRDFGTAIDNVAKMQSMMTGRVGPGISKLQEKIQTAKPMLLFALHETPLARLLEKTQGMDDELNTIAKLTASAGDFVKSNFTGDQVRRISGLGMEIAAPAYVSCKFVMKNVDENDITNLKLSRLRAKQISGIASLALKVLPKSQTVGINVVGGATLSIPNPVTPITAALENVANKYYEVSESWTKKYEDCEQDQLNNRLSDYLQAQRY
jgi:uncharacterized protein YoxC